MRIFIGVPSRGNPAQPFLESLARVAAEPAWEITHATVTGDFVPAQRELLARMALEAQSELLVFFDDDMVLPPQALIELTRTASDPRVGVVGGLYYTRDGVKPLAVGRWNSRRTTAASVPAFGAEPTTVDGVGFGCVAISTAWLRRLEPPLFSAQVYIEAQARRVRLCNEDYLFCERVRAEGATVLLHGGLRCGHFDRATGRVHPERWEEPAVTGVERMAVLRPDGGVALVPYDASLPEADDRGESCGVEYLWAGARARDGRLAGEPASAADRESTIAFRARADAGPAGAAPA
ncbi:MAG TPA: glycosyltransferase [Candidatus Dormibacteraeota bacterium]|nr:glycosyltransferase [Candidatus Dormibacteraeota bacterium]